MQHRPGYALYTLTSLLMAGGIAFAAPTASVSEPGVKDLTPIQRPVAEVMPQRPHRPHRPTASTRPPANPRPEHTDTRPPRSPRPDSRLESSGGRDYDVTAWVDHADNTYRFGENVVLNVKSDWDAYLTIVDVGTSGRVHIIFPNRFQTDNRIRAGETIQIPDRRADFDLEVHGPSGTELIKVIASPDPDPLFRSEDTEPAGPFKALKASAPAVAKDLEVVMRQPRHADWASYNKVIRIVPR